LVSLGRFGLSPATAPVILTGTVIRELQGRVSEASEGEGASPRF
jgi:hypothetical protein